MERRGLRIIPFIRSIMEPYRPFRSRLLPLPQDNIDTDQIYPGRFLTVTSKDGLAKLLFADWRYDADGTPKRDFVLNQAGAAGAQILLAGDNFGCGSSREHAPWALTANGFRAVISTSFADIFRSNSLKNGLVPIIVDQATHRSLFALVRADPEAEVEVDMAARVLKMPDGSAVKFPIDPFSQRCLVEGVDELGYLLSLAPSIAAYEHEHASGLAPAPPRPREDSHLG
jgi:3-isopropylmalate/(R)-2-methylmalate dehydratase small subunit